MYLIVGLGNPEPEYSYTRHNMGFCVVNKLAKKHNITIEKRGFKALYGTGIIENQKVIICKPQTYMNLSGESVVEIAKYYKIKNDEIIVIYDDIDIMPSTVRLRKKGGAGTHNGMKSVVQNLGTQDFSRIRIGIGSPEEKNELINYVIGKLTNEEYSKLENGIDLGVQAVEEILKVGVDNAMNIINAKS